MTAGTAGSRKPVGAVAAVVLAGAALAAVSGPAGAQEGSANADSATSATRAGADTAATPEYVREVFEYPEQGRRNPFEPVNAGVEEGPRFQNLRLAGVIYSPSVGSVAVLLDETTGKRYRVRDGQRIGDARVLEIRRSEVRFAVSGVGQARQETLQVEKQQRESQG